MPSCSAKPAMKYPNAVLNPRPLHDVIRYVGIPPETICSTINLFGSGTWNESRVCSSRCLAIVFATPSPRPYTSRKIIRGSFCLRKAFTLCPIKSKSAFDNSLDLLLASPLQDGTVGLYPVTELTFTLVPWIFVTL